MTAPVGPQIADGLALVSTVLNRDQKAYRDLMWPILMDVHRISRVPLELSWIILGMARTLASRDGMAVEDWWREFAQGMFLNVDDLG